MDNNIKNTCLDSFKIRATYLAFLGYNTSPIITKRIEHPDHVVLVIYTAFNDLCFWWRR